MKHRFSILVTDPGRGELLATYFVVKINQVTEGVFLSKRTIQWHNQPDWFSDRISYNYAHYTQGDIQYGIYSFPGAIPKDIPLSQLAIKFDAILFIIDLSMPLIVQAYQQHVKSRRVGWWTHRVSSVDCPIVVLPYCDTGDCVPLEYALTYLALSDNVKVIDQVRRLGESESIPGTFSAKNIDDVFLAIQRILVE